MSTISEDSISKTPANESLGGRARTGTIWAVSIFGIGQILRLVSNIILAAILFEEVFALMAIVTAVMTGLAMFTNIGLNTNVIQNPRGDDPDFLNTAWTLQVIRGFALFAVAVLMAWPLSRMYGANDPYAHELVYLIPIVAFASIISGFQSAKHMTAARHLRIKEIAKIEIIVGPFNMVATLLLAWYLKSAYALAISAVLSNAMFTALGYLMLEGPRSKFCLNRDAIRTIFSFGKWITIGTLITFLALQVDRLILAGFFTLTEFGVYSIAASLAIIVPTLVGHIQWSVLFPWYSRMLEQGMSLPIAFARTRTAMMVISSFLCASLIAGATAFFDLAYDERYTMGGVLLPILAVGAWFTCLENMYSAAFVASGRPKWTAFTNGSKVGTFLILLIPIAIWKLDIVYAAVFLSVSEVVRWFIGQWLGRSLGMRNARAEIGMFGFFAAVSLAGWWLVEQAPYISDWAPFWRLALLGSVMSLVFAPLFFKFVMPLIRQR